MRDQPDITDIPAQTALTRVATTDRAGMGATIDRAFGELFAELDRLRAEPAGPPYIRYLSTGEQLEIELGVPVASDAVPENGRATLPGGRAAVLRHTGPYEELPQAVERLARSVQEHGEKASGPFWESYVTNPAEEPDPAK